MSKRVISCVPTISAGLFAAAILLGTNCAALAAEDRLAAPNRPPAPGGHWYYRLDHVNNRKCWYVVEPEARTPTAEAPDPQPSSEPVPQPTFGAFFSSLSGNSGGSPTEPQPGVTGAAPTVQPAHPDDLRNDAATPVRQTRVARHVEAEAALVPKQHHPAHARPPAEHPDEPQAASLSRADRDALLQEFLRWREHQ